MSDLELRVDWLGLKIWEIGIVSKTLNTYGIQIWEIGIILNTLLNSNYT